MTSIPTEPHGMGVCGACGHFARLHLPEQPHACTVAECPCSRYDNIGDDVALIQPLPPDPPARQLVLLERIAVALERQGDLLALLIEGDHVVNVSVCGAVFTEPNS